MPSNNSKPMEEKTQQVLDHLRSLENPTNRQGMKRFGINTEHALGISMKTLRQVARPYRKDHELAMALWESGLHEARLLAVLIDDPRQLSEEQMETWVADIRSWDLCDQACSNLFDKWPGAYHKAREWSQRDEEFVKRAGFVLMAVLSVHDKEAGDDQFIDFFEDIEREADDPRNFVKKAVNWALRAMGKRNSALNEQALQVARKLAGSQDKTPHWVGRHALRELESDKVLGRLQSQK